MGDATQGGQLMASVNKAIIVGNLGRDPELRHTGSGTPVCEFPIATSERYQDKGGEWQDKDGHKRYTTEIKAHAVQFLSGRDGGQSGRSSQGPPPDASGKGEKFSDDEIPF